jgi:hypothetical protein
MQFERERERERERDRERDRDRVRVRERACCTDRGAHSKELSRVSIAAVGQATTPLEEMEKHHAPERVESGTTLLAGGPYLFVQLGQIPFDDSFCL